MGTVDKAPSQGNFLQACNLQPLAGFNDLDIIAGLQQALVGSGIEPGDSAPKALNRQFTTTQVIEIDVGNFEFTAGRRGYRLCRCNDVFIIQVQAGDGIIGLGLFRLFIDTNHPAGGIEFNHAVALRIVYLIAEDACATLKFRHDTVQIHLAVEDVVAQDQADRLVIDELLTNQKSLCNTFRFRLHLVTELDAPARTIAQQSLKTGGIVGS